MSFDIDPVDKHKRILCHHPDSDSLFICKSQAEFNYFANCNCGDVDDVTDVKDFEEEFKRREAEKND